MAAVRVVPHDGGQRHPVTHRRPAGGSRHVLAPVARGAAIAAAALNCDWVLESLVDGRRAPVQGYVSELGARTQPHAALFNAFTMATGLLLVVWLAAGRPFGTLTGRGVRWSRLAIVTTAVAAAGTVVDGLFPMDCAPSLSARCARAAYDDSVSWTDRVHTVESVVTTCALVASMGAVAVCLLLQRRRVAAWLSAACGVLLTICGSYEAVRDVHHHLIGTSERLGIALVSAWFVLLAACVTGRARSSRTVALPITQPCASTALPRWWPASPGSRTARSPAGAVMSAGSPRSPWSSW
jgi:hypothetical membrane protein